MTTTAHYEAGEMVTYGELCEEGWYWKDGVTDWVGPFETAQEAVADSKGE